MWLCLYSNHWPYSLHFWYGRLLHSTVVSFFLTFKFSVRANGKNRQICKVPFSLTDLKDMESLCFCRFIFSTCYGCTYSELYRALQTMCSRSFAHLETFCHFLQTICSDYLAKSKRPWVAEVLRTICPIGVFLYSASRCCFSTICLFGVLLLFAGWFAPFFSLSAVWSVQRPSAPLFRSGHCGKEREDEVHLVSIGI